MDLNSARAARQYTLESHEADLAAYKEKVSDPSAPEWLTADDLEGKFDQVLRRLFDVLDADYEVFRESGHFSGISSEHVPVSATSKNYGPLMMRIDVSGGLSPTIDVNWRAKFLESAPYHGLDVSRIPSGPPPSYDVDPTANRDFYHSEMLPLSWIKSAIEEEDTDRQEEMTARLHNVAHSVDVYASVPDDVRDFARENRESSRQRASSA